MNLEQRVAKARDTGFVPVLVPFEVVGNREYVHPQTYLNAQWKEIKLQIRKGLKRSINENIDNFLEEHSVEHLVVGPPEFTERDQEDRNGFSYMKVVECRVVIYKVVFMTARDISHTFDPYY